MVEGDGRLEPLEPHRGGEGLNGVHLLLGGAALPAVFVCLGAPKDHEVVISLREQGVILRGGIRWLVGLRGSLLGLALLAKGVTNVTPTSSIVLEEMLRLPSMEQAVGFGGFLKCSGRIPCQRG